MTKKTTCSLTTGALGIVLLYALTNSKVQLENGKLVFDFHAEIDLSNALYQIAGISNVPQIMNS